MNSRLLRVAAIGVCSVLAVLLFIFRKPDVQVTASIYLHTSHATMSRMGSFPRNTSAFKHHYVGSASLQSKVDLSCNCDDERLSHHGLPCRSDCALSHFMRKSANSWMFLGDDDDMINYEAFSKLLRILSSISVPDKEMVLAANIKYSKNHSFPHSGPGWIASRAFVKMLTQNSLEEICKRNKNLTDDLALGWLLETKYRGFIKWNSPWSIVATPYKNMTTLLKNGQWDSLPECGTTIAWPSACDIVSFHVTPYSIDAVEATKRLMEAPHEVKIISRGYGVLGFCRCRSMWCDLKMNTAEVRKRLC